MNLKLEPYVFQAICIDFCALETSAGEGFKFGGLQIRFAETGSRRTSNSGSTVNVPIVIYVKSYAGFHGSIIFNDFSYEHHWESLHHSKPENPPMKRTQRKRKEKFFVWTCRAATWMAVAILFTLLFHVMREGIEWLDPQFLDSFPSRKPERAGIKSALWGSVWLIGLTAMISIPLSIGSALYLEEYAPQNRWTRIVEINLANLAGMPSILYGLLGLAVFVRYFDLQSSLWSGSLTLSLLVLPVVVIAAKGAYGRSR